MRRAPHRLQVSAVVLAGVFMASLDLFIVNIAFPAIERRFPGTSLTTLSWVLNAYTIAFAALLVPAGRWSDRLGRRGGFLAGLAVFVASSAACALAPSVAALIAARALQATGAALMLPTSLGLLLPEYPPARRAAAIGLWAAVSGVAAAFGPPLGGLLVSVSWRAIFLVNVPIGLAAIAAGRRVLRERRDDAGARPDVLGAVLLGGAITALALAIVEGPQWGFGSVRDIALLAGAAALAFALGVRSRHHPAAVIEPVFVRTRAVALANLATLLFYCGFGAMLLGSVLFLTDVWHESVLRAGLEIAPGPAAAALCAVPGAIAGARWGQRSVGALGALLFLGSNLWRLRLGATPDYAAVFLPAMVLGGAGVGLTLPSLSAAATVPLPPARFATASGVQTTARQIGATLGVAVAVAVLGAHASDFTAAWIYIAATAAATAVALAALGPVRAESAGLRDARAPAAEAPEAVALAAERAA